mmetsp:Transcript_71642/g.226346  ORF Transcript_71642/g.226346 Transcript_71642/m.226346 type:complete len:238 (+) Transcript_71642:105-818(+)
MAPVEAPMEQRMEAMYLIGPSAAVWSVMYLIARYVLLSKWSSDYSNRAVSIVHAVLMIFLATAASDWSDPIGEVGGSSTLFQMQVMAVSLGYFLYDVICCLIISDEWLMNLIHHSLTMSGLGIGVLKGVSGCELTLCLLMMEASNPFMHARFMMKEAGVKDSAFALVNEVTFGVVFMLCRIILGPPLVYKTVVHPDAHLGVKAGALGIQIVSVIWFYKIAQVIAYKLSKKSKGKKKA